MCALMDNHNYRCYNRPMNRDIERWLIIGLCMILVLMSPYNLVQQAKQNKPRNSKY